MAGLTQVNKFNVPTHVVNETLAFLKASGELNCEGLVLWVGRVDNRTATITQSRIPRQFPLRSEDGIGVYVDAEELYDLNVWLHQNQLRLLAQVHSHGQSAYHSDTDDCFSVVTTLGGLSIVVPHFGQDGFEIDTCAVLRLDETGWHEISRDEINETIEVN